MKYNWKTIIVDDDVLVRKGLKTIINWSDYNLQICAFLSNGQEAYDYIMQNEIDAVITDIKMPRMSGVELVKKVRETGKPIEFLILSGYDDYEFLKEAVRYKVISYMLKPINIEELKSNIQLLSTTLENQQADQIVLKEGKTAMTNTLFRRLIQGAISQLEFENKLEFLGLENLLRWKSCTMVWLYSPDIGKKEKTKKGQFRQGLLQIIMEDKTNERLFFLDSHNIFYVICEKTDTLSESFFSKLYPLKKQLNIRINMIGGMQVSSIYELGLSYHSIQEYRMRLPQDAEFFSMNFCPYPTLVGKATKNKNQLPFTQDLSKAVHDLNYQSIAYLLLKTIEEGKDFNTICQTVFSLEIYIIGLLQYKFSEFINIASELNLTPLKFAGFSNIEEIKLEIKNFTKSLSKILDEDEPLIENPLVRKMIRYVKFNYASPISLKQFAYEIDKNPIYLGSLFFDVMGLKFTTFVTQYRLKKSCALLSETDFTISKISSMAGFSSAKYFFRMFRDNLGITPTEYRNKIIAT